jgi:hypothetical protein
MTSLLKISKSISMGKEFEQIIVRKGLQLIPQSHEIASIEEALTVLPENNLSVRSNKVHWAIAVALTTQVEAEVSLDFVIDRRTQKGFYLFTRGFSGAAISDYYYYHAFHPHFYLSSKYHTHSNIENKYGKYMPTNSDLLTLKIAYRQQVYFKNYYECPIEASIYFRDTKHTIYGINPKNGQFYAVTPDGAKYEYIPTEWEASFCQSEFSAFLHRYSQPESILMSAKEIRGDKIVIDIDAISQYKEKLGVEAYKDMILGYGEGFNFKVVKNLY